MGRDVIKYTDRGYIDMRALLSRERLPYIWITGARGAGKTFGAVDYLLQRKWKPFIYMRRTGVQARAAGSLEATPIKKNLRPGQELLSVKTKVDGLYRFDLMQDGELYNWVYVLGLAGVATMRGIDLSICDWVLFDEFIKEPHERPITQEFQAWANAMETIGRNREEEGLPPLRMVALSNALDLGNPYYMGLGIVDKVFRMLGDCWRDPSKKIAIYRPTSDKFLRTKKETALYQLGGELARKTLGNNWDTVDLSHVKSLSLRAARPICAIDGVSFYRIGSRLYAAAGAPASIKTYSSSDTVDRAAIHREQQTIVDALYRRRVWFESVDVQLRCYDLVDSL